jgi:hypothetical protein
MPLLITVDTEAVENTVSDMINQIAAMPDKLQDEVLGWQTDDMRRRYPNIERPDEHTIETDIWPRSRLSRPYKPRGTGRGRPRGHATTREKRGWYGGQRHPGRSTRPILRPELWDKLVERIEKFVAGIKWTVK